MTFRTVANIALSAVALIVISSFTFGAYLISGSRGRGTFVSVAPPSFETLFAQAQDHLENSRTEQALFGFRRALSLNPRSLDAQIGLARGELLAGREAEASREYERALKLAPDDPTVLIELARVYAHDAATWPGAEEKLRRYLAGRPGEASAELEFARVLAWRGKAGEAADVFARPAVTALMEVQDRKDYAFALVKSGQTGRAEAVLRGLLETGVDDARITLQLAHIYGARHDWNAALPLYSRVLREQPSNAAVNLSYGLGLLSARRYGDALGPLRLASEAMPSNGEAGLAYARALKGAGNGSAAAREFARVLPIFHGHAAVVREYADLLLERKNYGAAERQYKAALELGLRDARLYVGLSGALRGNRKPREAVPYLESAYQLAPTDRLAFELARLLNQVGERRQALALLATIPASAGAGP